MAHSSKLDVDFDSYSTPNLSRQRHFANPPSTKTSTHLSSSHEHSQATHLHPAIDAQASLEGNQSDGRDEPGGGKMSRSERKRMWRKNLSSEKLTKLRERDALRKRLERMNMSADKRCDLRKKDTARKAALRKERRMNDTNADQSGGEGLSDDLDNTASVSRSNVDNNNSRSRISIEALRKNNNSRQGQSERDLRFRHRSGDKFNKIPVQSLLN